VNRLLAALALCTCACAIRDARTSGQSGQPCSSSDQCNNSVCFLGECRNPASSLALVHAEVRSSDATYGTLQSAAIDLRRTPVADFTLRPALTVAGRVMQRSDSGTSATPVPGAVVVFTDIAPAIPDRVVRISAQSDTTPATAGGYTVRLPASIYDVLVAAGTSPVSHPDGPVAESQTALDLVLPAKASLAHVTGTLQINGSGLAGLQVSATDGSGTSIAVPQVSGANGTFALDLPPGPPAFSLQVGPQAAASANDPVPNFNPRQFGAGRTNLGLIDLGILSARATLTGSVVDARGAPVAFARVMLLSTGAPDYVLSAQTTTAPDGSFSALVREGSYLLEVAPDADPSLPAVSDPINVPVTAPALTLASPIVCPDKVKVTGVVVRSDGRPASAGFRVDATRLPDRLVTGRATRTGFTDASGAYSLVLDSGRYRVEITPTADSALPRTILSVDVPPTSAPVALPSLRISPPHELVGTVQAPGNPPVPIQGATIDFYATDSTGRKSVLIGSAVAGSAGQYSAVLPDVSEFTAQ
jgi:hypothetical protein